MDPFSITTGCVGLIGALLTTGLAISNFIQDFRETAEDFVIITRELSELRTLASAIQRDCKDSIPEEFRPQIVGILKNCDGVVLDIQALLDKHKAEGTKGAAKWALVGKKEVAKLQVSLEAHRNTLSLTLGVISVSLTMAVKDDTAVIRQEVVEVREIALHLMKGIQKLRRLEGEETAEERLQSLDLGRSSIVLERYLADMTSYAGSVVGEDLWEEPEIDHGLAGSESSLNLEDPKLPEGAEVQTNHPTSGLETTSPMIRSKGNEESARDYNESPIGYPPGYFAAYMYPLPATSSTGNASFDTMGLDTMGQVGPQAPTPTFVHLGGNPPIRPLKFTHSQIVVSKTLMLVGMTAGKTGLIKRFKNKGWPDIYLSPTTFETYSFKIEIPGMILDLTVWEPGTEYEGLRRKYYPDADIIMVCVNLVDLCFLEITEETIIQELRAEKPNKPVVLVGCQKDLRDDIMCKRYEYDYAEDGPTTWEAGEAFARKIGAAMYMECSAKTGEGVEEVFTEPFKLMFPQKKSWRSKLFSGA